MSRSHFLFRDVSMDTWVDRYEKSHRNPINRVFHTFGIPMIAVSIPLFLIAPLVRGFRKIPLSLFTAGWICQVLGHLIEGKFSGRSQLTVALSIWCGAYCVFGPFISVCFY
jgi:uncharacterized membrane protein YGL010W